VLDSTHDLVSTMRAEKYIDLATEYGWEIVRGHARFVEGLALAVELVGGGERLLEAEHYLAATGSVPWARRFLASTRWAA
jgi:mercuric reductase